MENFLQTDLPVRNPLDLDGPADGKMVGGNPFMDTGLFDPQSTTQSSLGSEKFDKVLNS